MSNGDSVWKKWINSENDNKCVERRVMNFSLKLVTLAKPVTSFNG
jgi:hypothetical protein